MAEVGSSSSRTFAPKWCLGDLDEQDEAMASSPMRFRGSMARPYVSSIAFAGLIPSRRSRLPK
jgi:hypothetical protein